MKRAEPGWLVVALGGVAALIGSFLPFYTYAEGVYVTVWGRGLFPTAALIPVLGLLLALEALFVLVVGFEPRSPFLNFTWEQVRIGTSAFMILLALSYLVQDRAGGSLGLGYVVVALASVVTFAGGIMTRRAEIARASGEKPPARVPTLKPVVGALKKWGGELTGNAAALGRNAKAHLGFGEANEGKQEADTPARVATLSAVHTETETAPEPEAAGAKAADTKPVEANPVEESVRDTKPPEPEPADAKAADAKPADARPAEANVPDANPVDANVPDANPADANVPDAKPAEANVPDKKPSETKPTEPTPADTTADETKPTEPTSAETTADETKPTEPMPAPATPKKPAPKEPAPANADTPADAKVETDGESDRDEESERPAAPGSGT